MSLTPADIRKKESRRVLKGHESDAREFLFEFAAELKSSNSDTGILKFKISYQQETVKEFRKMEQVLKDTFSRGHGAAELLGRNFLEDSEKIREGAKNDAEKLGFSAQLEVEKLQADICSLHTQKHAFLVEDGSNAGQLWKNSRKIEKGDSN